MYEIYDIIDIIESLCLFKINICKEEKSMSVPEKEYNESKHGSTKKYEGNYSWKEGWTEGPKRTTAEEYNLRRWGSTDKYGDDSMYVGDVGW